MAKNEMNSNTINNGLINLDNAIRGIVSANPGDYAFIVVLNDGEAAAIKETLEAAGIEVHVVRRGWGTNISHVADDLAAIQAAGKTPVLVEVAGAETVPGAVVIDHHGDMSDRPAALLQVLHLLGEEPSRRQQLIAANDSGYYPAMEALGATAEEMSAIRALDRSFQLEEEPYGSDNWVTKFTPEVEKEAQRAINAAEVKNGVTIIRISHSKTAAVTDPLYETGKEQRLLILSENGESNFFGSWELCEELYRRYGKEGDWNTWKGGETTLPSGAKTGFFGSSVAPLEKVEAFVIGWFAKK